MSGAQLTSGARTRLTWVASSASSASSTKEPARRASSTGGIDSAPRTYPWSALLLSGIGRPGWKLLRLGRPSSSSSRRLSRATLCALQGRWRCVVTPESRAERSRTGTDAWYVYAGLAGVRCSSTRQQSSRDGRGSAMGACKPQESQAIGDLW
eukprot:scaffold16813_cov55-Phaeocystis_antarctica.AAC.1